MLCRRFSIKGPALFPLLHIAPKNERPDNLTVSYRPFLLAEAISLQ